jgi:hypothetical protein
VLAGEPIHGLLVEVVVVIVGDDDRVDGRKVTESEAGRHEAVRPSKAHRARSIPPMGVLRMFTPSICTRNVEWPTQVTVGCVPLARRAAPSFPRTAVALPLG